MENKNKAGRTKGTPNRITAQLRGLIADILASELPKALSKINELTPKARIEVLVKLLAYVVPKPVEQAEPLEGRFEELLEGLE